MTYLIAVTSTDGVSIDLHFGRANAFLIVEIDESTGEFQLKEKRAIDKDGIAVLLNDTSTSDCVGHHDELLENTAKMISDCEYLLTHKIGFKPEKVLRQNGIGCLESPPDLREAVEKLNTYRQKYK